MLKLFHISQELAIVLCLIENSPCNASCCVSLRCSRCIGVCGFALFWQLQPATKMWRPDEKLTFLSSNCCLQWRIQERGPGPPLFLDQNELLMNTTLVIDGKQFQSNVVQKQKMRRDIKLLYDIMADTIGYELSPL